MNKYFVKISTLVAMALVPVAMNAQQTLTLEQCREMAIENNKTLKQAETKIEMAGYDRKIAFANYLPNISATGAYIYNANDIALVSDVTSQKLQNMGTLIHSQVQGFAQELMTAINPIRPPPLSMPAAQCGRLSSARFRRRICLRQSMPLARKSMTLSIRICRIFSQVR